MIAGLAQVKALEAAGIAKVVVARLEPGDVQIINSHVTLHSRTEFVDHTEAERKRLLFRLWLAPPDSKQLPASWRDLYRSIEPGTVRGGIRGLAYDDARKQWEAQQARAIGMRGA